MTSSDMGATDPSLAISPLKARMAGFFYLGTIVAGIFAEIGARSTVRAGGDHITASNILQHGELYRAGEAADLLMLCCYLAVTTLLYEMFASTSRQIALLAAAFSLTGIAVLASNGVLHMAPLTLLEGPSGAGITVSQRDALISLSLDLHDEVYGISLIFFGIYCILIGFLAMRSRLLPKAVGGLMMAGGLCHLITKSASIISPDLATGLPRLMNFVPLAGEATLALWLLLFMNKSTSPK